MKLPRVLAPFLATLRLIAQATLVSSQLEEQFDGNRDYIRLPSSAFAVPGTNATFDYIGRFFKRKEVNL